MTFDHAVSLFFFLGSWAACAFNWWIVKPLLSEMLEEAARERDGDEWKNGGDD